MSGQLFALQRDLDMVTQDVYELKKALNTLDFIAKTVKNLWDEQVCQSEQMKRMERDIIELKADVAQLKTDVASIKKHLKLK